MPEYIPSADPNTSYTTTFLAPFDILQRRRSRPRRTCQRCTLRSVATLGRLSSSSRAGRCASAIRAYPRPTLFGTPSRLCSSPRSHYHDQVKAQANAAGDILGEEAARGGGARCQSPAGAHQPRQHLLHELDAPGGACLVPRCLVLTDKKRT